MLIYSFIYILKIPAFIGLGLIFWGSLIVFIKNTRYVKKELFDTGIINSLKTIDKIISELGYKGKGIYISPRTLQEFTSPVLFIPYEIDITIPPPEELTTEKVFHENPKGICLTPLGLDLASILEQRMGGNIFTIDLNQLREKLTRVIIEDLEIAQGFELEIDDPIIHVTIYKHIFNDICSEISKLKTFYPNIGEPLVSSIACLLAKVTGTPIAIDRINISKIEESIDIFYRMLAE